MLYYVLRGKAFLKIMDLAIFDPGIGFLVRFFFGPIFIEIRRREARLRAVFQISLKKLFFEAGPGPWARVRGPGPGPGAPGPGPGAGAGALSEASKPAKNFVYF